MMCIGFIWVRWLSMSQNCTSLFLDNSAPSLWSSRLLFSKEGLRHCLALVYPCWEIPPMLIKCRRSPYGPVMSLSCHACYTSPTICASAIYMVLLQQLPCSQVARRNEPGEIFYHQRIEPQLKTGACSASKTCHVGRIGNCLLNGLLLSCSAV